MDLLESTLNKAMRDIINDVIGIPGFAIAAKQNAPRPQTPYCSVDIVSMKKVGWEEQTLTDRTDDPDIDEKIQGYREIMYSLNFYFSGAFDNATSVQIGLMRNSSLESWKCLRLKIYLKQ